MAQENSSVTPESIEKLSKFQAQELAHIFSRHEEEIKLIKEQIRMVKNQADELSDRLENLSSYIRAELSELHSMAESAAEMLDEMNGEYTAEINAGENFVDETEGVVPEGHFDEDEEPVEPPPAYDFDAVVEETMTRVIEGEEQYDTTNDSV